MNQRTPLRKCRAQTGSLILTLLFVTLGAIGSPTQEVVTLVNFNQVWKYDQSGLELGTAWRTNDYDDSSWPSGSGLLGFENTILFPYPLSVRTPLTISSTVTSYYFRTTFQFSGPTNDLSLIASNFVDDGCVIYLNGLEAGRVRVTNDYNAATFAQFANNEGQIDPVIITNLSLLLQGENCLAVEVHQSLATSTDVVWGMKLVTVPPAIPPDPPVPPLITTQPENQTVVLDSPVVFSVGVVGDPPTYQWQKDGANLASGTTATYTIPAASLTAAGAYRVLIANAAGSVTSSIAKLTVAPDLIGPKMVSAIVNNPQTATLITLAWSEVLNNTPGSAARDARSFTLTRIDTSETVPLTQILYSLSLGSGLLVDITDPDWVVGSEYLLTVNNVKDLRGNSIAPGSQIAVSWPTTNALIGSDHLWSFHNSASLEPDVADRDWFATNFVESAFWSSGRGTFYVDPAQLTPCFGALQTGITHQREPILFRTTFQRPAELGSSANLNLRFNADDGVVLYLNGQEFYRTNMAPLGWELDSSSRALADRLITCFANTFAVTNLLLGTNWFAAAVYENHAGDGRFNFGLELTLGALRTPTLPAEPSPTLHATRLSDPDNRLVLDWTGHGFALESTATFSNNLSYPLGPWIQVTNMANPYTNSLADPFRFFRLKK